MQDGDDAQTTRRDYSGPHTARHPIPTIQGYEGEKQKRKEAAHPDREGQHVHEPSTTQSAWDTAKSFYYGKGVISEDGNPTKQDHPSLQRYQNADADARQESSGEQQPGENGNLSKSRKQAAAGGHENNQRSCGDDDHGIEDTSEVDAPTDPKQYRKMLLRRKDTRAEREVTDPVTHLRVTVHDFTTKDLKNAPKNDAPVASVARSATGSTGASKSSNQLDAEAREGQQSHDELEALFPPPDYDEAKAALAKVYRLAVSVGLGSVVLLVVLLMAAEQLLQRQAYLKGTIFSSFAIAVLGIGIGGVMVVGIREWVARKVQGIWEEEVWEASRQHGKDSLNVKKPESTEWLNSLLGSIWPLVNPDLFISICDTLEVRMRAVSPPKTESCPILSSLANQKTLCTRAIWTHNTLNEALHIHGVTR